MEIYRSATSKKVRNFINDDLAYSILSKLPLKSLKRFGCVRKSWTLLFENHYFMSIFRNNFISHHNSYYHEISFLLQISLSDFYLLSSDGYENMVKFDLPNPFQEEYHFFSILDSNSVTGVLCLYTQYERVVFWNPATKEFKILPPSPLESVPPYQQFRTKLHGFGYDHVRDDYKLLRCVSYFPPTIGDCEYLGISFEDLPRENISHDTLWEIYSLKNNSWKKLDVDVFVLSVRGSPGGERLYLNGMCHWWHYVDFSDKTALASFDLVNEVFFTTPIPLDMEDDDVPFYTSEIYLVGLSDSIGLISWTIGTPTFHISILGEIGVKESWTKLFIIGPLSGIGHPIGAGKKGDIFFMREDDEIVWFNLSTQMIEELGVRTHSSAHILIYKESLLPIGGINH